MSDTFIDFQRHLMEEGLHYRTSDMEYLYQVAKECAKFGVASGAATAVMTAGAGSVMIPAVGAIPGWVAGFLAGWATGTGMCTVLRGSMKHELDRLLIQPTEQED